MCGINGIYYSSFAPLETADRLKTMNQALAHRGPDAEGIWLEGSLALGHRRLAIIDLSPAGQQPMHSADGRFVLVFNGEIYNYQSLRAELNEYPFRTKTDSEVILAAYHTWGPSCVNRLNGMFAFAIWDRQLEALYLVRDPLGIKPLYISEEGENLIFSSEIKGILASGMITPRLATQNLPNYFRYQTVTTPETLVDEVVMLAPGIQRIYRKNLPPEEVVYWRPSSWPDLEKKVDNWPGAVRNALRQAVERQLVSDVPFGVFLSGGIDSSAIVALMREVSPARPHTFSVTFNNGIFDESSYARHVAELFDTEHTEIRLRPSDFLDMLPTALDALDHPSGDGPNTFIVAQATKQAGISMALSGLGGDELFCGYSIFNQARTLQRYAWLNTIPYPVRAGLGKVGTWIQPGIASQKMAAVLSQVRVNPLGAYPLYRQVFQDDQIKEILGYSPLPGNRLVTSLQVWESEAWFAALPLLGKISVAEMRTYMHDVLLRDTDQMSMAHALEVRVPLIDQDLVSIVLSAPDNIKIGSSPKPLLVAAMADLLPERITHRPKMGFTLPFAQWMQQELQDFCWQRLQRLAERPAFQADVIHQYWRRFLAGDPYLSWSRLWLLVVLEHWLDHHGIE